MDKAKKIDRLQILLERITLEGLDGDVSRVAEKMKVPASTVSRVINNYTSYSELTTIKQQEIVNTYLRLLNDRKVREEKLNEELIK